jgi:hypothetical protein
MIWIRQPFIQLMICHPIHQKAEQDL